jgi:hypothetical protein
VHTKRDAVGFINRVGFCLLFPVKRLPLLSLYWAVARRPIHLGPQWDAACETIWAWKDELPRQRHAWYAKYIRGRGTFISLELLPHFLAVEDTNVTPSEYDRVYQAGELSHDAVVIWKTLAREGPLPTLELRHACRMDSKAGNKRFKRAMLELQSKLIVTHFGTEQETAAWESTRFELTARAFPRQVTAARNISPAQARAAITQKYCVWHPKAKATDLVRLFGWTKADAASALGAKNEIQ